MLILCWLQSYVVTHLPFVPKSDLKGQMNQVGRARASRHVFGLVVTLHQQFAFRYPQLSLSCTKIKRIQSLLADVGSKDPGFLGLEACTVALACVPVATPTFATIISQWFCPQL